MTVLVNAVCNAGVWEPRPFARKVRRALRAALVDAHAAQGTGTEGQSLPLLLVVVARTLRCPARAPQESTRVLGLLAAPSCPVHALALQPPVLPKALGHIRKHMQARTCAAHARPPAALQDACSAARVRACCDHRPALPTHACRTPMRVCAMRRWRRWWRLPAAQRERAARRCPAQRRPTPSCARRWTAWASTRRRRRPRAPPRCSRRAHAAAALAHARSPAALVTSLLAPMLTAHPPSHAAGAPDGATGQGACEAAHPLPAQPIFCGRGGAADSDCQHFRRGRRAQPGWAPEGLRDPLASRMGMGPLQHVRRAPCARAVPS